MWSCPPTRAGHVSAWRGPASERRTDALRVSPHLSTPFLFPCPQWGPSSSWALCSSNAVAGVQPANGEQPPEGSPQRPQSPRTGCRVGRVSPGALAWPQDRGQVLLMPQGRGQGLETPPSGQGSGSGDASGQGSGSGDTPFRAEVRVWRCFRTGVRVWRYPPQGRGQGLETPTSAPSREATRRAWEWLEGPSPEPGASVLRGPLP